MILKLRRKRLKRRIKRMAASCATAAMMSAVFLSITPAATTHASAAPVLNQPVATSQQVVKTPTGFHTVKTKVAAAPATVKPVAAETTSYTPQSTDGKKSKRRKKKANLHPTLKMSCMLERLPMRLVLMITVNGAV